MGRTILNARRGKKVDARKPKRLTFSQLDSQKSGLIVANSYGFDPFFEVVFAA